MVKKILLTIIVGAVLATPFAYRHSIRFLLDSYLREKTVPKALSVSEIKKQKNQESASSTIENGILSYTKPIMINLLLKSNDDTKQLSSELTSSSTGIIIEKTTSTIPKEFNLRIPFTSQAPHANWDMPYQEACEEASVLMSKWFIDEVTSKTAEQSDKEIFELIEWEKSNLGYYEDSPIEDVIKIYHNFFGLKKTFIVEKPTIQQIKEFVSKGYPVVVPASGKQLNNPNFRNGGPLYHMLVIRGYTENTFITNDPGTRKGKNYQYPFEIIMNAMHDWNNGDVKNGAKKIIVVKF